MTQPAQGQNPQGPSSDSDNPAKFVDLVCEGGGVCGIALAGALSVLDERGLELQNMAGTSAGAIVAVLRAAGYKGEELRSVIASEDFSRLMDPTGIDHFPLLGKPLSILFGLGVYRGNVFRKQIADLLARKGVRTFKDLVNPKYADQPRYRYKVQVIASDITAHRLLVLPQDAKEVFGIDPDDLEVALAVRMSMSIPIFFVPVRLKDRKSGRHHLIVDGALLSSFPVWIFDSEGKPEWPTFGLRLVAGDPKTPLGQDIVVEARRGIGQVVDFAKGLLQTMTDAHDRMYLERDSFARTIAIPTLGVDPHNFRLTHEQIDGLYQSGRQSAEDFLQHWNFPAYVAEFRSGKTITRRQDLIQDMQDAIQPQAAPAPPAPIAAPVASPTAAPPAAAPPAAAPPAPPPLQLPQE
jgi:NTE family protein